MSNNLMEMLAEAGYPKEKMYHHESDLYIFVTPLTTRVLEEWCDVNGWSKRLIKEKSFIFDTFRDQDTKKLMYDVAFQYLPFWENKEA